MEVECKVKLHAKEADALGDELTQRGIRLGNPETQRDVYFKERGFRQHVQGAGSYLVRVRYGSKITLNMKHLTNQDGVWEEVESEIQDGGVAEQIIEAIGGERAVTVTKSRRMGSLGNLEVIIDNVEELGTFLELAVETNDDTAAARQEIDAFLDKLGIARDRVELRGYPTILLEEQGVKFSAK